jgi:chromosome segregation ATPase
MLKRMVTGILFASGLWLSRDAAADKIDDFKDGASRKGCDAIPYRGFWGSRDERRVCEELSREKDNTCTAFSCEKREAEKALENYKEKKKNLDDAKSRKNEAAIPDLEAAVKKLDEELKTRKSEAEKRIRRCDDCIKAREAVQTQFAKVKDMVKNETDKDLQQYVRDLVSQFEAGAESHVKPLEEVKGARSNCDWVSRMSW